MNVSIIALGVAIILVTFVMLNFVITPQMRNQIGLSSEFCGSFFGQIGGALSPSYAQSCQTEQTKNTLISLEGLIYLAGVIVIIYGFVRQTPILPTRRARR